jgi:hypothetical protein
MFTTGMSDMTEAATISYLVQSNDPTNGLRAWLQRIDDRANTNCKFYVEAPYRSIDQQTFQMVRAGAQIYYQFILGHEFAHLQLGGPTCGSDSPEPLKQESTCDKFSFDHQWAFGNLAPNFVVVPLIALAHYDSLLDDRLGSFIYPAGGMTFREMFPAADWQARARQVAQWWTDKCSEPSQSNKPACKGSFQAVWADSKNYIELPMPHSCTDTDASRSSEMNPAGNMEGVLCKEITTVISDAASDFKNTLGPVDDPATPTDGGSWHSNRILPGAAGCTVFGRDANTGAFFRCDYNTTSDMAENDKLYSNLVNEISACFPKWTKETSQKTYPHSVESTADLANGSQNLAVVEKKRARTADIYIRIDAPENPK